MKNYKMKCALMRILNTPRDVFECARITGTAPESVRKPLVELHTDGYLARTKQGRMFLYQTSTKPFDFDLAPEPIVKPKSIIRPGVRVYSADARHTAHDCIGGSGGSHKV